MAKILVLQDTIKTCIHRTDQEAYSTRYIIITISIVQSNNRHVIQGITGGITILDMDDVLFSSYIHPQTVVGEAVSKEVLQTNV